MERRRPEPAGLSSRAVVLADAPAAAPPMTLSRPAERSVRPTLASLGMALFGFIAVAVLAVRQGGYFPSSWSWMTLAMLWVIGLALVLRGGIRITRRELLFLGALVGLALWTFASAWWSVSRPQSLLEAERTLLYLSAAAAVVVAARRRTVTPLLGGVAAAIAVVSTYSLGTRLFPLRLGVEEPMAVYRLSEPVGYWNALGIFAAMGLLLAVGFTAFGRTLASRAGAAAAIVVLAGTLYFTFGRGPWVGLGIGLLAALLVSPRRLKLALTLIVVGPFAAAGVILASQAETLTRQGATLQEAAAEGRRVGLVFLLLAAGAAAAACGAALVERRTTVGLRARRAFGGVLLLAAAVGLVAVFERVGGPLTVVDKAYSEFTAPPPQVDDMSDRLFNLSGNGRADLWRLAWDNYQEHGWRGSGAGTYERYYLANKPTTIGKVRDAHGLYIEFLSELGPVGLTLLVLALALPVAGALAARHRRLVPAAFGAYVAFLAHAAIDWDWEVPAVTLSALVVGGALLVAARGEHARVVPPQARLAGAAIASVLALATTVALLGHAATARSETLRVAGKPAEAEREAITAARFHRWSPEPWAALAEARLARGDVPRARAAFQEALELDSGDWRLWVRLARVSDGAERARALGRATELNPHGVEVAAARRALLDTEQDRGDG
jgi:tetratricopeptide (TPR) repeat protein